MLRKALYISWHQMHSLCILFQFLCFFTFFLLLKSIGHLFWCKLTQWFCKPHRKQNHRTWMLLFLNSKFIFQTLKWIDLTLPPFRGLKSFCPKLPQLGGLLRPSSRSCLCSTKTQVPPLLLWLPLPILPPSAGLPAPQPAAVVSWEDFMCQWIT